MFAIAFLLVRVLCDGFKARRRLEAEILVLRHQLNVLQQRAPRRLYLTWADRALFVWLYRGFPRILDVITILRPETIVRWHRKGFRAFWRWKSRPLGGRPQIDKEVRDLIRRMTCGGFLRNSPPIIMGGVLMFRLGRIHRTGARSSASEILSHMQSWADCITGTHESSFWKRHHHKFFLDAFAQKKKRGPR